MKEPCANCGSPTDIEVASDIDGPLVFYCTECWRKRYEKRRTWVTA